eukprot:c9068_g1_i1.p1 GENE.c9068_g1_i1~~c9068_g1_i1.p1  ORF type:complete len:571 (+),score=72.79 c9068_g1_i1:56-1768(+)
MDNNEFFTTSTVMPASARPSISNKFTISFADDLEDTSPFVARPIGLERTVLEQTAWPRFNFIFWAREFILQTFYPLTIPYFMWNGGAAHRHLTHTSLFNLMAHNLFHPLVWAMLVWWIVRKDELSKAGITISEILSSVLPLLANRACIATKYAYLTHDETRDFFLAPQQQARKWMDHMQILSSWFIPKSYIVAHEIWMSARMMGLNIRRMYVVVPRKHVPAFTQFLERTHTSSYKDLTDLVIREHEDGTQEIPVFQIMYACVLRRLSDRIPFIIATVCHIVCILRAVIFGLVRYRRGVFKYGFLGDTSESAAVTVLEIFLIVFWYRTLIMFIAAGVLDVYRRYLMVCDIGDMIRICEEKRHGHPVIDLSMIQNIAAWVAMRRMVPRVGYRYQLRLTVYLIVSQILCLVFAAELLATVASAQNPENLKDAPRFIQAICDLLLLWVPMGLTIGFGALVNRQLNEDLESLISHRVQARTMLLVSDFVAMKNEMKKELKSSTSKSDLDTYFKGLEEENAHDDLLDTSIQAIESLDRSNPVAVLGLRAELQLLVSCLTVLGSIGIYVVRTVWLAN